MMIRIRQTPNRLMLFFIVVPPPVVFSGMRSALNSAFPDE